MSLGFITSPITHLLVLSAGWIHVKKYAPRSKPSANKQATRNYVAANSEGSLPLKMTSPMA